MKCPKCGEHASKVYSDPEYLCEPLLQWGDKTPTKIFVTISETHVCANCGTNVVVKEHENYIKEEK